MGEDIQVSICGIPELDEISRVTPGVERRGESLVTRNACTAVSYNMIAMYCIYKFAYRSLSS